MSTHERAQRRYDGLHAKTASTGFPEEAAVYLVPGLLYAAESIAEGPPSTLALGYWMVLAVLTATLATAAWRIRRQQLTQHQPPANPTAGRQAVRRTGRAAARFLADSTST